MFDINSGGLMLSGIYQIRNLVDNKIYIGSTKNFKKREKSHFSRLKNKTHHSLYLQNAYNKYGQENFIFEILLIVKNQEELLRIEQTYLDEIKPFSPNGYNISKSATNCVLHGESNGMYGKTGINSPNFGKKRTLESRHKISEAHKGKVLSIETKQKLSKIASQRIGIKNPMYGKTRSRENREKISKARSEAIIQYDKYTGDVLNFWNSAKDCEIELGISASSIGKCCSGKAPTAGGFIWRKKSNISDINKNIFDIEGDIVLDSRNKIVYQYDSNKNIVKIWKSIAHICNDTSYEERKIRYCLLKNSKKISIDDNGFIWSYNKIN